MGLLIGTIGMSPNGVLRGTLGSPYLIDGVTVLRAMIGMFAASELFALVGKSHLVDWTMGSEARRVGQGHGSPFRSRERTYNQKTKSTITELTIRQEIAPTE